jgi:hypothetical protein
MMARYKRSLLALAVGLLTLTLVTLECRSQEAKRKRGGPIVLNADDVPAFPDPPPAFDAPHVWHVDGNGHDPTHWRNSLYYFSQRIFR